MTNIAVLFPGQGTQMWGMGKELYEEYSEARAIFDEADAILGYSFTDLLFKTDSTECMKTSISQIAIFLTSVAYYKVFIAENDIFPDSFAGHSVGEYAAFVCSGMMTFKEGLLLVEKRGKLMQSVSDKMKNGGMLAVMGLTFEKVDSLCKECRKNNIFVHISTYNDERQVVIAGTNPDIESAQKIVEENGARTKKLDVNTAFHNPCMNEIIEPLVTTLKNVELKNVNAKVYCNVIGKPYISTKEVYELLPKQAQETVQWYLMMRDMVENGTDCFIEVGRGNVLSNLLLRNKQGNYHVYSLSAEEDRQRFIQKVKDGSDFGKTYLLGAMLGELISQKDVSNSLSDDKDEQIYSLIKSLFIEHKQSQSYPSDDEMMRCINDFLLLEEKKNICCNSKWLEYRECLGQRSRGNG